LDPDLDLDLGHPHLGPPFGTPIWDPDLGPRFGTPPFGTPIFKDHDLGPRFKTPIWDLDYPDLEPRFGTPMSLAKFKQNSSDMNEIILAPCDAGYVQSCTGYRE
jgi:hypothetical protein